MSRLNGLDQDGCSQGLGLGVLFHDFNKSLFYFYDVWVLLLNVIPPEYLNKKK